MTIFGSQLIHLYSNFVFLLHFSSGVLYMKINRINRHTQKKRVIFIYFFFFYNWHALTVKLPDERDKKQNNRTGEEKKKVVDLERDENYKIK